MGWWSRWADETVWVSKNSYAIFSGAFRDEWFFNRGGFVGVEKVPKDAIQALEKEFSKRRRRVPAVLVEDSREWDVMRAHLSASGYKVTDRMMVMESAGRSQSPPNRDVGVDLLGPRELRKGLREWTRVYLEAFYGSQRLNAEVSRVMQSAAKDKKVSVLLARMGESPAGCAVVHRSAGGIAGAYCIGTVPRFREKGVAAALVRRAQEIAQGEKRRLVIQTLASDKAERFYVKQGFKQAYIKSVFERRQRKAEVETRGLPSGEGFGVRFEREAPALPATPSRRSSPASRGSTLCVGSSARRLTACSPG